MLLALATGLWVPVMHRAAWIFSRSRLSPAERVDFFPAHGVQPDPENRPFVWEVKIGGVVYEKPWGEQALIRGIVNLALLFKATTNQADLLAHRIGYFTKDFNRGKAVEVRLQGCGRFSQKHWWDQSSISQPVCESVSFQDWELDTTSTADGVFWGILRFEAPYLEAGDFITFSTTIQSEELSENLEFFSEARLVSQSGIGVISDIDDTIRESGIGNVSQVLTSTFLEPFQEVQGMASVYRRWLGESKGRSLTFHYVSGSPWQLQEELKMWMWGGKRTSFAPLAHGGFPYGSFHLKSIRFELLEPWGVDASILRLVSSPLEFKLKNARRVLKQHRNRKFILVGDSGEKDPEIYGQLYREHPDQIICIIIRETKNRRLSMLRTQKAFNGVPSQKWKSIVLASDLQEQKISSMQKYQRC